jgi:hypothetical protein
MSEVTLDSAEDVNSTLSGKDIAFMRKMAGKAIENIPLSELASLRLDEIGWESQGLCGQASIGPDSAIHPDTFLTGTKPEQIRLIGRYCFNCPVLKECRLSTLQRDAMGESYEIIGLQGGQTQQTRKEQGRYNRLLMQTGSTDLAAFPLDKKNPAQLRPGAKEATRIAQESRAETPAFDPETQVGMIDLANKLGVSKHTVRGVMRRFDVESSLHYGPSGQRQSYMSVADAQMIEVILAEKSNRQAS